jgi:hypothetical protein
MATSYPAFLTLPFEQQLPLVWSEGRFLAQRSEEEDAVALYLLDGGFFCEVYLEQEHYQVLEVVPFVMTDSERLEHYACYIRLDDLLST